MCPRLRDLAHRSRGPRENTAWLFRTLSTTIASPSFPFSSNPLSLSTSTCFSLTRDFPWQWEDKLRSECSRLKAELDELHAEEKHLAVESMKVQKEQEVRKLRQSWEQRQEEMTKEVSWRRPLMLTRTQRLTKKERCVASLYLPLSLS